MNNECTNRPIFAQICYMFALAMDKERKEHKESPH